MPLPSPLSVGEDKTDHRGLCFLALASSHSAFPSRSDFLLFHFLLLRDDRPSRGYSSRPVPFNHGRPTMRTLGPGWWETAVVQGGASFTPEVDPPDFSPLMEPVAADGRAWNQAGRDVGITRSPSSCPPVSPFLSSSPPVLFLQALGARSWVSEAPGHTVSAGPGFPHAEASAVGQAHPSGAGSGEEIDAQNRSAWRKVGTLSPGHPAEVLESGHWPLHTER